MVSSHDRMYPPVHPSGLTMLSSVSAPSMDWVDVWT